MSGGDWKQMFKGVQQNDLELVKYYLKMGIDPNYQHPEYMALPLAESIRYNHLEIARILLENGAKPNIVEMESAGTCMDLATKNGNLEAVNLLNEFTVD